MSLSGFPENHDRVIWLLRYASLMVPTAAPHIAASWSGLIELRGVLWLIRGIYAIAFGFCFLHFHDLVVDGYLDYPWGKMARPGPFFVPQVAFFMLTTVIAVALAVRGMVIATEPRVRLRMKYWLLGMSTLLPLGALNYLGNLGFGMFPVGRLAPAIFVVTSSYAIVRRRVLPIDTLVSRATGFVVVALAVAIPFTVLVIWVSEAPAGSSALLGGGPILIVGAVSVVAANRWRSTIEAQVGALFPARRAARAAIWELATEVVRLDGAAEVGRRVAQTIQHCFDVTGVALYRQAPAAGPLRLEYAQGFPDAPPQLPPTADNLPTPLPSSVGLDAWEYCVTIPDPDRPGLVALGAKRSGAAIDDADQALLALLASRLGIAWSNIDHVTRIESQKSEIEGLQKRLAAENRVLRLEVRTASRFSDIVGSSQELQQVLALVERVAPTDTSVLITGETGTGKELIARALHDASPRRDGPLITVNCPAIPVDLAESELFGRERGAFTGAVDSQPGRFELAQGGSIFLDEVADLPQAVQTKLLRVLQEREVQRVGGRQTIKLDVRIIAATNKDLQREVRAGKFREDLYYRLAALPIELPALRARSNDIPMLASFFLERSNAAFAKSIAGFSPEAMTALKRYAWPGNIRELQNVVERAVLICDGERIEPIHLPGLAESDEGSSSLRESLRDEKRRRAMDALTQAGGNQAAAARLLGMSRSNFARLLRSLGIKD